VKSKWAQPALPDMICPVTGRQYVTRPEWVGSSDHHLHRLGVLDGELILCQSFGRSNLEDVQTYCVAVDAILQEYHRPGRKMVLIEDYTHLGATDNISRQAYISHHLKLQDDLHGVLFFGLNPFLKLIVRLSRRIFPLRMIADAFPDYASALESAFQLMGRKVAVAAPAPVQAVEALVHSDVRVEFCAIDAKQAVRIKVEGHIRGSDISPLFQAYESFLYRQALQPQRFYKVVDYSGVTRVDWTALLAGSRQLNRINRLFPARRHVITGLSWKQRFSLVVLNLAYRDHMDFLRPGESVEPYLEDRSIPDGMANSVLVEPSLWQRFRRLFKRDQWESAWKLMEFIGEIQWDSGAKAVNPYPVDHPFHQVAISLLVVKSDFDSLIAERLRREKELEDARERAEEANRLQARFLANVSHEIRTPLNAILGMGEMLSDTDMDPVQQDLLRTMRQSSQGLLTVINDILDLSRMEAGEFRLSQDAFDMASVLDEVGRMMGYLAGSKGLEWRVQKVGSLPAALRGDPVRLRQVLLNLAGNAVKFTERGHVFMEVRRLRNTHGSAILQFRVEDSGPGIPPDRMGEIFQPFRQLDGSLSRRHGGTGLGLAIAHNLVRQMGGNLGVESSPVGSVFGFRLSLPEVDHHLLRADSSSGSEGPLVGRVLVAEDNRVNQKVVVGLLAKLGLESDVVGNGRLTLEALKQSPGKYQLVLMDIQMPEMDGIEAVLRIRSGEAGENSRKIPVVALTAHAMEGDRELFLQQGMDDYISKPIRLTDLRGAMERWIGELHPGAS
jgi:signal transduction histidine kinase/ActR/RegA family two-component response regulator